MANAQPFRLVLLEASKTKHQHSTVVDGLLRAAQHAAQTSPQGRPTLYAHTSLFERLSVDSRSFAEYRPIPVMDPERRQLIRKSLLEAAVVFWTMLRLKRKSELLLITTLLPSAGMMVEIMKWFFPRKAVVAMVHGEIEGALDPAKRGPGSYGFYVRIWFALRRFFSRLDLAVIDGFIAEGMCSRFPGAVSPASLYVLPLLIEKAERTPALPAVPTCCFIGYDTPKKGFDVFVDLCARLPELSFRIIGGGVSRDLRSGETEPVTGNEDFIAKIARCDIALFPYKAGYDLSLSAAATDAIAAGVHLVATARPCFVALEKEFGPELVTICPGRDDMERLLKDRQWLARIRAGRDTRLSLLANSRYDIGGVARAIENLLDRRPFGQTRSDGRGIAR